MVLPGTLVVSPRHGRVEEKAGSGQWDPDRSKIPTMFT